VSNQLDPHMQIARKVRSIDTIKIELLQQVVDVYKGIQTGHQREVLQGLGSLIGTAYFLGVQLGVSPAEVDRHVESSIPRTLVREETDITDSDIVKRHFSNKR
jgi:hypothetical protein